MPDALAAARYCECCNAAISVERVRAARGRIKYCSDYCSTKQWRRIGKRQPPVHELEDWHSLDEPFFRGHERKLWEAVCIMCSQVGPEERLTDEQVRLRRLLGEPHCTNCRGLVYLEPSVGPRR